MSNEELFKETGINKDTTLIRPTGGSRTVHVINCSYIKDWNVEGCSALTKFNPAKMNVCPTCETLVYIASGAKDYASNKQEYADLVKRFGIYPKLMYNLIFVAKAKLQLVGERLYIRKKHDTFYIDFALDDVKFFHNNYSQNARDVDISATGGGFHEHQLINEDPDERFKEAVKQVIKYKYEEAKKTHAKKRKKAKPKITFDQFDNEYWGFSS